GAYAFDHQRQAALAWSRRGGSLRLSTPPLPRFRPAREHRTTSTRAALGFGGSPVAGKGSDSRPALALPRCHRPKSGFTAFSAPIRWIPELPLCHVLNIRCFARIDKYLTLAL